MSTPVSIFLRDLRLQLGLTQVELANLIGYEQAYVSSIELGTRGPSKEFLQKLTHAAELGIEEQRRLEQALHSSNRRFALSPEASTKTYLFCNDLWDRLETLHPALLDALHALLIIQDQVAVEPRIQRTRLKRRSASETPM
ncbi:helix-turn-helix transcriptional regulator [Variovorax sp. HJSM1_2]|uniref:helix-turn-helix transcriptional regulator n=1 Tax=Variovorax sp. HJSM1_2 TaxID=3366263 RepID=UPI003BCCFC52